MGNGSCMVRDTYRKLRDVSNSNQERTITDLDLYYDLHHRLTRCLRHCPVVQKPSTCYISNVNDERLTCCTLVQCTACCDHAISAPYLSVAGLVIHI